MRIKSLSSLLALGSTISALTLLAACGSDDTGSTGGSTDPGGSSDPNGSGGNGSTNPGGSTDPGGSGGTGTTTPPSTYSTETKTGIATWYDATGAGSCSYDATPNDLDVVAFNQIEFAGSATCGSCLKVTGPNGTVTVRVVDRCPECAEHHLDLSNEAFAKIADPKDGRINITYQTVACNQLTGNIKYRYKDHASKWWTAIQVLNHKLPIAKLEYKLAGQWIPIERLAYNYFVVADGVGDQPNGLSVRVTAADGQVLEDVLPGDIVPESISTGAAQFK